MRRTSLLVVAFVAGGSSIATPVFAQSGQDFAAADQLFREAKQLMAEQDFAHACPKLEESYRLDPQPGTVLNLGVCYESIGRTASAWGAFTQAVSEGTRKGGQAERVAFAKDHLAALESKLSRVEVRVAHPTRGETIKIDGRVEGEGALGTPLPLDPGDHALEASAPGKATISRNFSVATGPSSAVVEVPALENEPAPAKAAAPPSAHADHVETTSGGRRTLGFVLGGVGIAGIATGSVIGAMYLGQRSKWADCGTQQQCDATLSGGESAFRSRTETLGWISTASFGVGAVGLVAGAYLILTSKSSQAEATAKAPGGSKARTTFAVAPLVTPRSASLAWSGAF